MTAHHAWSVVRSILYWGIPAALVATLVWTFLPHGGVAPRVTAPPVPAASRPPAPAVDPSPPAVASTPGPSSAEPEPGTPPFAEIRQGDLEGADDTGRPRWRIVADVVTVVHDKNLVLLRNVRATLFERDGGTTVVTGARGRLDTATHEVELDGGVHGKSSTGRELFADQLRWLPKQGKVTGTGHIRLIQESVVMYADGMTSDTILGQTQFFGHVHASAR
jgi:LPS export ABC transporter protein LptC